MEPHSAFPSPTVSDYPEPCPELCPERSEGGSRRSLAWQTALKFLFLFFLINISPPPSCSKLYPSFRYAPPEDYLKKKMGMIVMLSLPFEVKSFILFAPGVLQHRPELIAIDQQP